MKDTPVEIGLYLNGNLNDRRHLRTRSNGLGVVTIDFNGLWHKIPQEVEFVQVIIIAGLRSVFVKVPINKVVVKLIELPAGSYATLLSTDVDGMQGRALSFRTGWKARLVSSRGSRDGLLHICKDSFVGWIDSPFRVSEKPITYYAIDGGQSCQLDIE
ncbi:hypothetical protein AGMMS50225_05320 [Betaproteobacteria bacterium]|nr:hypothetical protein AGMMS50225_05320 [Betaproteobacteria bacterium]